MYTHVKSLEHHTDTVNCLSFTKDAWYLVSGDDSGLVVVTDMKDYGWFDRYHLKGTVTATLWIPDTPKLVVGLGNCELHFISLENKQAYTLNYAPAGYADLNDEWKHLIQINYLAYDDSHQWLAIAVRVSVIVVSVRNLQKGQFREKGTSAVDSKETLMVCSNLYDGFDVYNIKERQHVRSIRQEIPRALNVALPALFVHNESDFDLVILLGLANGQVTILSTIGSISSNLPHNNKIIQAIAYCQAANGSRIVATGSAEKGAETSVRIWIRPKPGAVSETVRRQLKDDFQRHLVSKSIETEPQQLRSSSDLRHQKTQPPSSRENT
ncbi:hypothetical protein EST38_g11513 [Candolleomyces aberdarensis]|uniref:Uncharacterized protein n=1 Tax=Candolleomyces aberdarensis TaxID=2316362 RepID=A0A4V1Q298_9AGAR|nr:hypothetical protein EST38_g11513 [Candolleomyces aberdarensis]